MEKNLALILILTIGLITASIPIVIAGETSNTISTSGTVATVIDIHVEDNTGTYQFGTIGQGTTKYLHDDPDPQVGSDGVGLTVESTTTVKIDWEFRDNDMVAPVAGDNTITVEAVDPSNTSNTVGGGTVSDGDITNVGWSTMGWLTSIKPESTDKENITYIRATTSSTQLGSDNYRGAVQFRAVES